MKIVLQRVSSASVEVSGEIVGAIDKGFLVLFGAAKGDTKEDADRLAKKVCNLRIFEDENERINKSLNDVGGSLLVISQFTLCADCSHGNRPSFFDAMAPNEASELYDYFCEQCKNFIPKVEKGIFGESMKVSLVNEGPFTITLE